jgi:hypothetical protein
MPSGVRTVYTSCIGLQRLILTVKQTRHTFSGASSTTGLKLVAVCTATRSGAASDAAFAFRGCQVLPCPEQRAAHLHGLLGTASFVARELRYLPPHGERQVHPGGGGLQPCLVLVVGVVQVARGQEVELDVVTLVGQDAALRERVRTFPTIPLAAHRFSNSVPLRATNWAVLSTTERMSGGGAITPTAAVWVSGEGFGPAAVPSRLCAGC